MSNGPTYSADDYVVKGATKAGGILNTYQQEIADSQKELEGMVVAAKQQVLAKQKRDHEAAKAVYGTTLGEMYDGDREAVQVYRDYIYNNYESGAYTNNPVQYQKDVAQLNNLITGFTNFYTETYGTSGADGTGTTYRDMVYNQTQGIENPFEAQGMKYDPNVDPFDQAQKTLAFRQMGGYAPNSVRVNEDGVLVARSLTYQDNGDHIVGDEMPIVEMQDRQIGNQTFMPALVEDTTTIFDYIKNNKQDIVSMYNRGGLTVEEANAEYFDNEVSTNTKFQRDMIKANATASITNEDIKAYQEGSLEGNKKILIEQALEKSRQEFIKSASFVSTSEGGGSGGGERSDGEAMFTGVAQDFSLTGPATEQNLNVEGQDVNPDAVTYGGEDPIGTGEGESVDYMGLSRGIPPIEMTGGQYGDYNIVGIAAADNGDRYAIIEEDEFVMKQPDGITYKVVPPGTPGATKSGTVRKRINLTTPESINDAGDVDPRIDDINRALTEYNGAYNQLVLESQDRLKQRSEALAQERAEAEKLRLEQERRDAEYEAANDPNINVEAVNEEAIKDVEEMQAEERENQEIEDQKVADARYALFYSELSDYDKQFYRAPGEQAPEFNIWGQRIGGGTVRYGDQGAFTKAHGKEMKDYARDILASDPNLNLSDSDIEAILNSPELEGALKEQGFRVGAVGGVGLQKAAEFIGQGAYPKKKEQINKAIDNLIETGVIGSDLVEGMDARSNSFTTMEEILDNPIESEEEKAERARNKEATDAIAQEETTAYWNDVREKAGDSFWGSPYANESDLFVNNGINTITDEETLAQAIKVFGNPPSGSIYRDLAKDSGLLKNSFKAPTSGETVDVTDGQASMVSYLMEKGNMSESAALALASVSQKESGGDHTTREDTYRGTDYSRAKEIFKSGLKNVTRATYESWQKKGNPEFDNWFWETVYGKDTPMGKQLGNKEAGDGEKFRGRGLIQLTGRANYAKASQFIYGDDTLLKNPELIETDPDVAGKVAAWVILNSPQYKNLSNSEDIDLLVTEFNDEDTQQILDTAYAAVAGYGVEVDTVSNRTLYSEGMPKMQDFVLLTEEESGTEQ